MKTVLTVIGIFAIAIGLLWVGQGTGVVRWPANSFMIDMSEWTLRGALVVVGGLILVWLGRRR